MKKFIFAIYTTALISMIPAIFIAYLNHDESPKAIKSVVTEVNASSSVILDETTFNPGLIFILKGI